MRTKQEVETMLMRTDPFRELDRIAQALVSERTPGTWSRPSAMPMDAYRAGDELVVMFDLPGVTADAIEVDVERNVLTVKAERRPTVHETDVEMQVAERPLGVFSRQIFLGDTLDTDKIRAEYESGVLSLRIPVAEQAKAKKVEVQIGRGSEDRKEIKA
jgi:HSP20 family protein